MRRLRGGRRDAGGRGGLSFHRESQLPGPHGKQPVADLSIEPGNAGGVGDPRGDRGPTGVSDTLKWKRSFKDASSNLETMSTPTSSFRGGISSISTPNG